ncbi:MAG: aminotransferase class V-fold PLP-dependent enzyme [Vicinamibacterales bacterium]
MTTVRHAPLAMDAETFRRLGHQLVDQVATRLSAIPQGPVTRVEPPSAVREALDLLAPLPEAGTEPGRLLEEATRGLFEHSLFNGHPRFFGYITSSPAPIGILADLLAAAVNPNVGAWALSPAATEIEAQTIRWVASFIGFPTDCGGLFVSGGNMANFVCVLAARVAKAGPEVRERGVGRARQCRIYASAETHTWLHKAADISGLGTDAIRWVPTDAHLRMDVDALRRQIEADRASGELPCLVVGTAGTVSTGAVDPLADIRAVCSEHDVWFHIDGAYGGFAAALPDAHPDLLALAHADSVAVDPHKWLYAPLEAGCVLVRQPELLRAAFAYHPPYYHFDEQATNYVDYGPQNSRGFRALKVWLALKQVGASGYRHMLAEDIQLARAMADAVVASDELQLITQNLSITTFRYIPSDLRTNAGDEVVAAYLDALNRALLDRVQQGGDAFVSNAVVHGTFALRACIVNFHTTHADVDAMLANVVRLGREADAALRPVFDAGSGLGSFEPKTMRSPSS